MDLQEKLLLSSLGSKTKKFWLWIGYRGTDPITSIKFNDAWNHKDQEQCKLWRDAI